MTSHIYHDDILEHGFCDECDECQNRVKNVETFVFRSDDEIFQKYWDLANEFIARGGGFEPGSSELDKQLIRLLERHIETQRRIDERLARLAEV